MKFSKSLCICLAALTIQSGCALFTPPVEMENIEQSAVETHWQTQPPSDAPQEENPLPVYDSPEELIEAYLAAQYEAYATLVHQDISHFLDTSKPNNYNMLVWFDRLIQRRRLLGSARLCYVEQTKFDYDIEYVDPSDDERMEAWKDDTGEDFLVLHFRVNGESDKVYPPFLAVNSVHSVWLKRTEGHWIIDYHYYAGVTRRFLHFYSIDVPNAGDTLEELEELEAEFQNSGRQNNYSSPAAQAYDKQRAVDYALQYLGRRNNSFYSMNDWHNNCANFTSQCILSGFDREADYGVGDWSASPGAGTLAWENVDAFWEWAAENAGIQGEEVSTVTGLEPGGLLQTRTLWSPHGEGFQHAQILVDKEKLIFAQNSPDCLVYYSDLVGEETRFFNPHYL